MSDELREAFERKRIELAEAEAAAAREAAIQSRIDAEKAAIAERAAARLADQVAEFLRVMAAANNPGMDVIKPVWRPSKTRGWMVVEPRHTSGYAPGTYLTTTGEWWTAQRSGKYVELLSPCVPPGDVLGLLAEVLLKNEIEP